MRNEMSSQNDDVAILLCTYNGECFLEEQLNSFEKQVNDWRLFVSDDHSNFQTLSILKQFQKKHSAKKIMIQSGPQRGFAANFLSLTCSTCIQASYYAFSDQDDVWEPNKLSKAIAWLQTIPSDCPALFCSSIRLIDSQGNEIGFSKIFKRQPHFSNALVENIATGHTMVFNQAARELLLKAGSDIRIPAHDWWLYLVVSACGGKIYYDSYPSVRYRQHKNNVTGYDMSLIGLIKRAIHMFIFNHFKLKIDMNIHALERIYPYMTTSNQIVFENFKQARHHRLIRRIFKTHQSGIYRQTLIGNIGLVAAILTNKI